MPALPRGSVLRSGSPGALSSYLGGEKATGCIPNSHRSVWHDLGRVEIMLYGEGVFLSRWVRLAKVQTRERGCRVWTYHRAPCRPVQVVFCEANGEGFPLPAFSAFGKLGNGPLGMAGPGRGASDTAGFRVDASSMVSRAPVV